MSMSDVTILLTWNKCILCVNSIVAIKHGNVKYNFTKVGPLQVILWNVQIYAVYMYQRVVEIAEIKKYILQVVLSFKLYLLISTFQVKYLLYFIFFNFFLLSFTSSFLATAFLLWDTLRQFVLYVIDHLMFWEQTTVYMISPRTYTIIALFV